MDKTYFEALAKGLKIKDWLRVYAKYVLPVILLIVWVQGYISKFF